MPKNEEGKHLKQESFYPERDLPLSERNKIVRILTMNKGDWIAFTIEAMFGKILLPNEPKLEFNDKTLQMKVLT